MSIAPGSRIGVYEFLSLIGLASLNHPNTAAIYGFEDTGTQALGWELVEGPTLADRIVQGPTLQREAYSKPRTSKQHRHSRPVRDQVRGGSMNRLTQLLAISIFLTTAPAFAQPPNVVLIITDDLGWADIGSYGATDIKTPHIDSLARRCQADGLLRQWCDVHAHSGRLDLRPLPAALWS